MGERQVDKNGVVIATIPTPCIDTPRKARSVITPSGDFVRYNTIVYVDEDGNQCAKRGEAVDMRAYKNASLEATDLANIKARLEAGDTSVINMRVGLSGDLAALPHDAMELNALANKAQSSFNALPQEIKDLFGSYTDFFNSLLEGKTNQILSDFYAKQSQSKEGAKEGTDGAAKEGAKEGE